MNIDNTSNKRLEVLKASLAKKEANFTRKLDEHYDDVLSANGQPLNDKRNGQATMDRWERQNDSLRALEESIQVTKRAIEREEFKIKAVNAQELPECLIPFLNDGTLTQWRKYPNRFFVKDGGRARLIWNEKSKKFQYSHLDKCTREEAEVFKKAMLSVQNAFTGSAE